jgi:hypothetical protein
MTTNAKCGVIIDQSDSDSIECDITSILTNEGVPLCAIHAIAYDRNSLLTHESKRALHKHMAEKPTIFEELERLI